MQPGRQRGELMRGFRAEGYAIDVAREIEEGLWLASENPYDILIFDVSLADGDGFTLCGRLRRQGNSNARRADTRDSVNDRVRGLDAGAEETCRQTPLKV